MTASVCKPKRFIGLDVHKRIATFVYVLLLTGCAPLAGQSGRQTPLATSIPIPTPVPIATWVAQGIPSDLSIHYDALCMDYDELLWINADGSTRYDGWLEGETNEKTLAGALSPQALKRIVLAFEEYRFFYLEQDSENCIYDTENPPSASEDGLVCRLTETCGCQRTLSIRINGIYKGLTISDGYGYVDKSDIYYATHNQGGSNFRSIVNVLLDAVKDLPQVTPVDAGTVEPSN